MTQLPPHIPTYTMKEETIMAEQNKSAPTNEQSKQPDLENLGLEQLKDVTGGSIHNVVFTKTSDISEDTKKKI